MAYRSLKKMNANVKDPEHCGRVVRSLQSFNSQQSYTDLCFVCARGLKVYAHKLLVCSVSTQLKELLLQLPDNLSKVTIHVPDVHSRILQLIISLLYEGSVRVTRQDYEKFKDTMNFLGIVLEPPGKSDDGDDDVVMTEETFAPQRATPSRAPQMLYLGNPSNSPGGVQYVLAPSSMVQGSPSSSSVQPSSAQSLVPAASAPQVQSGNQIMQLVQSPGGQIVPFSSQMVQSINGQLVQAVSGRMMQHATRTVQSVNSKMILPDNQMVHPVNNQITQTLQSVNSKMILPDNQMVHPVNNQITLQSAKSQMIAPDNQTVSQINNQMLQSGSNQIIQQTAQMVSTAPVIVQNNRHTIINNTTQVNLRNEALARKSPLTGTLHSDLGLAVRKRLRNVLRPQSPSTRQPVADSGQGRTLMRRRTTGPIVTGVHSLAGTSGHILNMAGTTSGADRGHQLQRRSQDHFF